MTKPRKKDPKSIERRLKSLRTQIATNEMQGHIMGCDRRYLWTMFRNLIADAAETDVDLPGMDELYDKLDNIPLRIMYEAADGWRVERLTTDAVTFIINQLWLVVTASRADTDEVTDPEDLKELLDIREKWAPYGKLLDAGRDEDAVLLFVKDFITGPDLQAQIDEWGEGWEQHHEQLLKARNERWRKRLEERRRKRDD